MCSIQPVFVDNGSSDARSATQSVASLMPGSIAVLLSTR